MNILNFEELVLWNSCLVDVKDRLTSDYDYTSLDADVYIEKNKDLIKILMVVNGLNPYDTIDMIID